MADSRDFMDAILVNCCSVVEQYLEQGFDPNTNLGCNIPEQTAITRVTAGGTKTSVDKEYKVAGGTRAPALVVTPLHVAIINCYHNAEFLLNKNSCPSKIVAALLQKGADTQVKSQFMVLCNIQGFYFYSIPPSTPTQLALFLKKFPETISLVHQAHLLDAVIKMIESHHAKSAMSYRPPTVPVPKSVVATYNKLLFSEKFSDITFICKTKEKGLLFNREGVVSIPAHRVILSAASPFFETALEGPWLESASGKWESTHPDYILRNMLRHIYVGKIDYDLLDEHCIEHLKVASEFQLDSLLELAVASCIRALSISTVKSTLQEAQLHNNTKLKNACFAFVKQHAAKLLTHPDFLALATEDAALWTELSQALGGGGDDDDSKENTHSSKRARTDG